MDRFMLEKVTTTLGELPFQVQVVYNDPSTYCCHENFTSIEKIRKPFL